MTYEHFYTTAPKEHDLTTTKEVSSRWRMRGETVRLVSTEIEYCQMQAHHYLKSGFYRTMSIEHFEHLICEGKIKALKVA